MTDVTIERAGRETVDRLEPLWAALQEHHARLPGVPPVRSVTESWARRRRQYERWLADGSGRLFVALRGERAVGYLMLRMGEGTVTWDLGNATAEVETVAVLEGERSSGVGGALMDAALEHAEAEGAGAVGVGVVHTNADGIRFYERAGFRPFYVELLRVTK